MALTSFNSVTVFTIVSIILLSFSFPSNALSINSCEKSIYRISPFNSTLLILVLSGITFCNFSFFGPSINCSNKYLYGFSNNRLIFIVLASGLISPLSLLTKYNEIMVLLNAHH